MMVSKLSALDWVSITAQFAIGYLCLVIPTESREYCWETFNATCPDGEVVVMQNARYGRMKQGRCLKVQRTIDCSIDVMYEMDRLCSGRSYCELDIPDTSLHRKQPCPEDMMSYLEADFVCLNATRTEQCGKNDKVYLPGPSGYISNVMAENTAARRHLGSGSSSCPFVIEALKGQKINITLLDFSTNPRSSVDQNICNIYANMREIPSSGNAQVVRVCGGETREKRIYLSEGNAVEIEIVRTVSSRNARNKNDHTDALFLLKYEEVGCPDFLPPQDGWVSRKGDQATVECNNTSEKWHLVCDGMDWVGDFKNCSIPETPEEEFPFGLVVAVGIGLILGIVIGVLLLAIVMMCQRRYRAASNRQFSNQVIKDADKARVLKSSEYGYAHVWELQQLRTHPEGCVAPRSSGAHKDAVEHGAMIPIDYTMHSSRCPYSRHNREHTYECPQMVKTEKRKPPSSFSTPFHHDFEGIEHAGRSQSMTESSTQPSSSEEARYTN